MPNSRGLKVRKEYIPQVRSAQKRSHFVSQAQLAEAVEIALCTVQRFLHGKPVDKEIFLKICEALGLPWEKFADLDDTSIDPKPLVQKFSVSIRDLSNQAALSCAQQLHEALETDGQAVLIADSWLQCSDEELEQYECFLLLVSKNSVADIIMKEVKRVRQLCNTQPNKILLLIHIKESIALPLNHPLHKELQGIEHSEWQSSTDSQTLVVKIIELLESKSIFTDDLEDLVNNVSRLELTSNWLLTYVGENPLYKLNDFIIDLKNKENRRIQSGYSYCGVGPTRMWNNACYDPAYHMLNNIQRFPQYARKLTHLVDKNCYNFVSLGVGEGTKDKGIISDFFNEDGNTQPRDNFLYVPVDMSREMLRVAIGAVQELPVHRRIAIQRDIETQDGMTEIAQIAQIFGQQQPIMYGFIGNTIANVEKPKQVLDNIVRVMRDDDLLLFEVQIIDPYKLEPRNFQRTISSIQAEYENISFRKFAFSALLQNAFLNLTPIERDDFYTVEVSSNDWQNYGQVIQIDCFFENKSTKPLHIILAEEENIILNPQEKIRLYRSRKFLQSTLHNFIEARSLRIIGEEMYLHEEKGTGFVVMMLERQK
ncbi:L-histidine N(alpha)-methyltransferase [Chlorogloeopsis sp. ULAP01]|uniref:L-histidine N(alpha)-methyltransferase n=1 Tax=Chlorogloeopsis sp. ULAP01 TaxID=3056483 RepID=UPI0025AB304F|nr:L-histidine N(alpha)-methyltransferase [Chlorogloeopsis sp. ULAP01]MDM9384117.1 L-histidine N(alpha)-methyltransferase [Chlorogloeopsis sp. ULAP01]